MSRKLLPRTLYTLIHFHLAVFLAVAIRHGHCSRASMFSHRKECRSGDLGGVAASLPCRDESRNFPPCQRKGIRGKLRKIRWARVGMVPWAGRG
jgi:hypothetical protein